MLVLSQKRNEQIVINGPCIITLNEIRGNRIKLGFTADKTTKIRRAGVAGVITETPEEKAA